MSVFDDAFEEVIELEGGLADAPADRGGRTKWGITQETLMRAIRYGVVNNKRVDDLSREEAQNIYWTLWWTPLRLGELPEELAFETFEQAVNFGPVPAVKHLQQALVWLGAPLDVDGINGDFTIAVAKALPYAKQKIAVKIMNGLQFDRYLEITSHDPSQRKFFIGWLRRVEL